MNWVLVVFVSWVSIVAHAKLLIRPSLSMGAFYANNYYATSSPNITVNGLGFGFSNDATLVAAPWLTMDVALGYDEEKTSTTLENNRAWNGSLAAIVFPLKNLQLDTAVYGIHYRSDRYDSGNINVLRFSETMQLYWTHDQYASIGVASSDYRMVKTGASAKKLASTLGIQTPWNIFVQYGHATYDSSSDTSDYTEHDLGLSTFFWPWYPWVFSARLTHVWRNYTASKEKTLTGMIGISHALNANWKVNAQVWLDANVDVPTDRSLQVSVSLLGAALLDGTLKPTNATRRRFLFDDALKAMDAKDLNRAKNVLDRILFFNPDDVEALFERALLAHEQSDSEASVIFFKRVIELDPSIAEAQYLLAYHLRQLGDDRYVK